MITDQSTDREYRRMPCEVVLLRKDLSAATLVLIYYARLHWAVMCILEGIFTTSSLLQAFASCDTLFVPMKCCKRV